MKQTAFQYFNIFRADAPDERREIRRSPAVIRAPLERIRFFSTAPDGGHR
jgi:hypothetical protein